MTTKAIQLAKECGASCGVRTTTLRNADLETFYAKTQAQALREAAIECDDPIESDRLRHRAAKLESKT